MPTIGSCLSSNSTARFDERQEPIVGIGYHHEWAPGIHTIVYGARLADNFSFTNQAQPTFLASRPDASPGVPVLTGVQGLTMHEGFAGRLEIYSGEVQQIFQQPAH